MTDNKPTIEDDVPGLDDNVPDLEDAPTSSQDFPNLGEGEDRKQSRAEKKARKAVAKLGLKQVTDIFRIAIKKSKGVIFVINDPEVFKAPNKESYVVFGEAKVEDGLNKELERAASQFKQPNQTSPLNNDEVPDLVQVEGETPETNKDNQTGGESEEGVEQKDIELVMQQVTCTRSQAIAALKKNNGDIVNAIMDLQF
eukprot:TRINITY_DN430_c0_g1_i1.p1 TRINITY_DN430_c0_g1~~TRINITY_DN430_c0_g1_i1.p1  ORF type:complete len:198 (+),score=66.42 TRINITY_DN430_c0_g1_i1:32-625(+)